MIQQTFSLLPSCRDLPRNFRLQIAGLSSLRLHLQRSPQDSIPPSYPLTISIVGCSFNSAACYWPWGYLCLHFGHAVNEASVCVVVDFHTLIFKRGAKFSPHGRSKVSVGIADNGCLQDALKKLEGDTHGTSETFADLLQWCIELHALAEGRQVHAHIRRAGLEGNLFIGNKLINMYVKCASLVDAWNVLDNMSPRNVISWTAIIAGYSHHGCSSKALQILQLMIKDGMSPNQVTFLSLLNVCNGPVDLLKGRLIHAYVVECGFHSNIKMVTTLVDMYGRCESKDDARGVFDQVSTRDVVLWTAMIHVYVLHGHGNEAIELFRKMQYEGAEPNEFTLSSVLSVCGNFEDIKQGKQVHLLIVFLRIQMDRVIGAALVSMYVKCGDLANAREVFDRIHRRDVVLWTAIVTGYAQQGYTMEALRLFQQMQIEKIEADVIVGNALINLHSKSGHIEHACRVFNEMPTRDLVSWSTLITGFVQKGNDVEALELFRQMLAQSLSSDKYMLSSVVCACANLVASTVGNVLYSYIAEDGLEKDIFIVNALINMYVKCGSMDDAHVVFSQTCEPDVIAWNSLILGYGQNGYGTKAFEMFERALVAGVHPDQFTFSAIISSCASLGMLTEGNEVYNYVIKFGLENNTVGRNALIDLYAVSGSIEDAFHVFSTMPERTLISWSAMIGGCAQHGQGINAVHVFEQMLYEGLQPDVLVFSSLLSACSHAGLIAEGCHYFKCISQDHAVTPTLDHYGNMVDLLGRTGCLIEAENFIYQMPIQPNCSVWRSLLGACCWHGNVDLAEVAAENVFSLEPQSVGAYILLSNTYASSAVNTGNVMMVNYAYE